MRVQKFVLTVMIIECLIVKTNCADYVCSVENGPNYQANTQDSKGLWMLFWELGFANCNIKTSGPGFI